MMKFVCTYSNGNVGVGQELVRYLSEKGEPFVYLEHPMEIKPGAVSRVEEYSAGRLVTSRSIGIPASSAIGHYLKCTFRTFDEVKRRKGSVDVFVGHSNIDCIAAALACRGSGAKIVYCSIDYMPRRFPNALMNAVYRVADRLAYKMATVVWHSYPGAGKLKRYAPPAKCVETLHGNNYHRIRRREWSGRNPHGLVYLGGVGPAAHIENVLSAMKNLSVRYPDISLDVIGTSADSGYMDRLSRIAAECAVADRVKWHGRIEKADDFEEIMARLGVGLCLYEMNPSMPSWYQLPGKVFAYAACGLPAIALDVSGPVATGEIKRNGIGIVTTLAGLEESIAGLFADTVRHREIAGNAVKWAAQYDWKDKFDKQLGDLPGKT